MTEDRRLEVEVELPVTPEQAWEAIATGPGITAWFMPAEVEGRVGGSVVLHPDPDMSSSADITAFDPPHRFAFEESNEEFAPRQSPSVVATEFLVESRSGDSCVVRVVMSGFGDGEAWDAAIESYTAGWRQALLSLRLYLTHFRGDPVGSINIGEMVGADGPVWDRFAEALGLPVEPTKGEPVATTGPDVPVLAGRVEQVGDGMVTILLEEPAPGVGLVGVGGGGEDVFATVRAQLFGPEAEMVAAREQEVWKAWLTDHFS